MKRLLLPLIAALALPTAVNANFYDEQTFKRRWPIFVDEFSTGTKFQELEDYEMMCERFVRANNELKNYFTIFQKYQTNPNVDLFGIRAQLKTIVKACGEQYSIY